MELNCEGCAGCCIDWRSIAPIELDHERRGMRQPIDPIYNFVSLNRENVKSLYNANLGDAMTPRLWEVDGDIAVSIDGFDVAAIDGKPVYFVGLRKPVKPVGPFGHRQTWLPSCVFLDPENLQCRIHDEDHYPTSCREYPAQNLTLNAETECERVETAFDQRRLLDRTVPTELSELLLGPHAVGQKLFVHPKPKKLTGVIDRVHDDQLTESDRAEFVATAIASSPGTTDHDRATYREVIDDLTETISWAGEIASLWNDLSKAVGSEVSSPERWVDLETRRDVPETPGW